MRKGGLLMQRSVYFKRVDSRGKQREMVTAGQRKVPRLKSREANKEVMRFTNMLAL
jgi:hypothetical protein